jgi:hypothetical protein
MEGLNHVAAQTSRPFMSLRPSNLGFPCPAPRLSRGARPICSLRAGKQVKSQEVKSLRVQSLQHLSQQRLWVCFLRMWKPGRCRMTFEKQPL